MSFRISNFLTPFNPLRFFSLEDWYGEGQLLPPYKSSFDTVRATEPHCIALSSWYNEDQLSLSYSYFVWYSKGQLPPPYHLSSSFELRSMDFLAYSGF